MPDKLKKSAGLSPLLIPRVWALALPLEQNKQCRGPRFMIYIKCVYQTMDEEHCVIAVPLRICEIQTRRR